MKAQWPAPPLHLEGIRHNQGIFAIVVLMAETSALPTAKVQMFLSGSDKQQHGLWVQPGIWTQGTEGLRDRNPVGQAWLKSYVSEQGAEVIPSEA